LSRILAQLEGSANGTDITPQSFTIPTFTPTPSDVRINTFWFLSLILSLTTVLTGIIALQWLREHLRPHTDLEPQIAFSLHRLNVESLDRWYLPQIFTALPLLLQLALFLFMSGVVEFLWSLNSTVALPISVAVGLSLFFRVCTTVMPTIQALLLFLPRLPCGNLPRSPCPYRSPQSWVFYQLVRPLVAIFLSIYDGVNIDKPIPSLGHRGLLSSSMILEKDRDLGYYTETTSRRRRRPINLIFRPSQGNGWAKFGAAWLYQRDLDFMGQNPRYTKNSNINEKIRPVPIYDAVQAVISKGRNGSSRDNLLAHHCIQTMVQCNKSDGAYMWYLSNLADNPYLDDDRAETVSVDALMHTSIPFLHSKIGFGQDDVRTFVVELVLNITRAMFADGAIRLGDIWCRWNSPLCLCEFDALPGTCIIV